MAAEPRVGRTSTLIAAGVLGLVTILGFIAPLLPGELPDLIRLKLTLAAGQWWAPVAGVALFTLLASLGAPQIVLITTLVLVFGGVGGFIYSMIGKLFACALGFWVGRRFGAALLSRYQTPTLAGVMRRLARHGFWASAVVRLVPTVPSVVVNIAAGATPMGFLGFMAGTALGSVPKMAAIAFGGRAAVAALQGDSPGAWMGLAAAVVLWLVVAVVGRRMLRRWRADDNAAPRAG
jgi:uncharacterized membrane protein YdjX (TVP38/TMEM64 family)